MEKIEMPSRKEMLRAFSSRDAAYDGVFVTGVKTTGIFCRPTCPARKPRPENVVFFATPREALTSGYRPCLRCRPLEIAGTTPDWLRPLLDAVEEDPSARWMDDDLRRMRLDPGRVRRWFKREFGLTFQAYSRLRRLAGAAERIREGESVTRTALDSGFDSLSGFNDAVRRIHGTAPSDMGNRKTLVATRISTPLGPMVACADGDSVCLLEFADRRMLETQLKRIEKRFNAVVVPGSADVLKALERELAEYFAGRRRTFDVPLILRGTPFQERTWKALLQIPYGQTVSYAHIAERIGNVDAVRAVARANGDNRIAIVVPCHRVIGKDGSLTGYGGGLWRKKRLLDLESGQLPLGDLFDPPA
jgi:AraC family transcriptional regulator of adaptative response/methylated-DNA-[protein]-cysteine methyltransferase